MGLRKDDEPKKTLDVVILEVYYKWKGEAKAKITVSNAETKVRERASRIAAKYSEDELRLAVVMRNRYERELEEMKKSK